MEVDPRSSVRMSASVSFQLKKQIEIALHGSEDSALIPAGQLSGHVPDGMSTPPNRASTEGNVTAQTTASSVPATPDRSAHVEVSCDFRATVVHLVKKLCDESVHVEMSDIFRQE